VRLESVELDMFNDVFVNELLLSGGVVYYMCTGRYAEHSGFHCCCNVVDDTRGRLLWFLGS
jgi:hypothetical protein